MNKKLGIVVGIIIVVAILIGFFLGQMTARTQSPTSIPTSYPSSVSISSISHLIYPAVIGAITGAIVSTALMYLMYNMMFKKERRRELLEKRLEKLYSPLYTFTKRLKEENESAIPKDIMRIEELIEKNCYLASEELQPFLTLMRSYYFSDYDMMRDAPGEAEKMFELIKKEYNELRDEYFACKEKTKDEKINTC